MIILSKQSNSELLKPNIMRVKGIISGALFLAITLQAFIVRAGSPDDFAKGAEGVVYSTMRAAEKYDILNKALEELYKGVVHDYVVRDKSRRAVLMEVEEKIEVPGTNKYLGSLFYNIDAKCNDTACNYAFTDVDILLPSYDSQGNYTHSATLPLASLNDEIVPANWELVKLLRQQVNELDSKDVSGLKPRQQEQHYWELSRKIEEMEEMLSSYNTAVFMWEHALQLISDRVEAFHKKIYWDMWGQ